MVLLTFISSLLIFGLQVYAATNGTGDFTGEMGGAIKAWTNYGSTHGPTQDESGYYISVYCCDVLGEAGKPQ